ncbi:molybdenum transport protein [Azospirillum lipoferum]|uniref:Putative pyrophosphorylase ModD n=1 Tax=Azospirillum lipoferum TaxID=193 RepID=A0A5A9GBX2_AZOLI|nr:MULTISPECIES: ModD protein [Azospirillum]KAA0592008.1 ModD protein [Azospirillum lipoferum]MCP1612119.1 molybdenum transport protein [Azospirillum lipoferum]MDW5536654.1 ModD protein [Azospirillum sp. NL1]
MTTILPDAALDALLAQDVPYGDLTTDSLGIAGRPARMSFAARGAMVLAGTEAAARLVEKAGGRVLRVQPSGTAVDPGVVFLEADGPAGSLHRAWKVAQTLVEYASGIATRARRIVEAAPGVTVACTRKNFPGSKDLSVKAVQAGGAVMHRLGLSETLLVFPEHRAFLGDSPEVWIAALRRKAPEKKIVVEVGSVEEAVAFARAGADVIQLEKLPPDAARAVIEATRDLTPPPVVAPAGGVTEANAAAYAAAGCHLLITSAPFFGQPADVKVVLGPA